MAPNITPGLIEGRRAFRLPAIVAWALWVVAVGLLGIGLLTPSQDGPTDLVGAIASLLVLLLAVLPAVSVGAILATRFPRNPVGWLLLISGLTIALNLCSSNLATYGLNVRPGSVPGAVWFAWLNQWAWLPAIACAVVYLPLVFPSGRLLSRRWRAVTVAGTAGFLVATAQNFFTPFSPGSYLPSVQNPLSVSVSGPVGDLAALLGTASHVVVIGAVFLALASLVTRFRRAAGVERQQLKWFATVIAVGGPAMAISLLTSNVTSGIGAAIPTLTFLVAILSFALLPIAIGIAILRYRLYEIDRLISRTLVYGTLAGLLAVCYAGSVLLLSALLTPFTSGNSLAVAGSTLVVAALFQPVRARLGRAVDRRFFRARYDAARELAAFAARLRDQVDLAQVSLEIADTAERVLQPTSVSIWLREKHG